MGFEPEHAQWPPLRLARVSRELVSVVVVSPLLLREFNNQEEDQVRSVGRAIGLDVHLEFCEVAIAEAGVVRSTGRIETTPERCLTGRRAGQDPDSQPATAGLRNGGSRRPRP